MKLPECPECVSSPGVREIARNKTLNIKNPYLKGYVKLLSV